MCSWILQGQYYLKQREIIPETARREAWMVVTMIVSVTLLVVILFLVTLLLILSHRKGGLSLFGNEMTLRNISLYKYLKLDICPEQ